MVFYIFFHTKSSKFGMYFTLTAHLKSRLVIFQVLKRYMWQTATILETATTEIKKHTN